MPNDDIMLPQGVDPQSPQALRVPHAEIFENKTKPDPVVDTRVEKHYMNSVANASIHRKDGTRIGFIFGHFSSSMKADKDFLDNEIEHGHPNIRHATDDEIRMSLMRKDPRGTMRKEIESDVRADLEVELRAKLLKEIAENGGVIPEKMKSAAVDTTDPTTTKINSDKPNEDDYLPGNKTPAELLREKIASGSGALHMQSGNGASHLNPVGTTTINAGADRT